MKGRLFSLIALLLLVGLVIAAVQARGPQQTYDLSWWTADGGGGGSSAVGSYTLDGTAGQPDPGPVLSGENYALEGGFWGGVLSSAPMHDIYLPLVVRSGA